MCPGPILTEATEKHAASEGKTVDALVEEMSSQLIVKRMGSPKEVANAVLFLVGALLWLVFPVGVHSSLLVLLL